MALVVEQAAKDPEVLGSNPTFYPLPLSSSVKRFINDWYQKIGLCI